MKLKPIKWDYNRGKSKFQGVLGVFEFEVNKKSDRVFYIVETSSYDKVLFEGRVEDCKKYAQEWAEGKIMEMVA